MPEVVEKKSSFKKTVRDEVKSERLGDLLRKDGQITKFQLDEALAAQKKSGGRLGQTLISLGFIDEETIINFLSRQKKSGGRLGQTLISIRSWPATAQDLLPEHRST